MLGLFRLVRLPPDTVADVPDRAAELVGGGRDGVDIARRLLGRAGDAVGLMTGPFGRVGERLGGRPYGRGRFADARQVFARSRLESRGKRLDPVGPGGLPLLVLLRGLPQILVADQVLLEDLQGPRHVADRVGTFPVRHPHIEFIGRQPTHRLGGLPQGASQATIGDDHHTGDDHGAGQHPGQHRPQLGHHGRVRRAAVDGDDARPDRLAAIVVDREVGGGVVRSRKRDTQIGRHLAHATVEHLGGQARSFREGPGKWLETVLPANVEGGQSLRIGGELIEERLAEGKAEFDRAHRLAIMNDRCDTAHAQPIAADLQAVHALALTIGLHDRMSETGKIVTELIGAV